MTTLNGGFSTWRGDTMSPEDRALVDDFIRTKGVTKLLPAGADSNEATRSTKERIAQARRDFRSSQKKKK